ncbi:hypothetical protein, partial [Serratia nevei]|uniref:hypothetical protein n=1 Tax=Serratia nevei TaxID=2703794 RepID=UPI002AA0E07E
LKSYSVYIHKICDEYKWPTVKGAAPRSVISLRFHVARSKKRDFYAAPAGAPALLPLTLP